MPCSQSGASTTVIIGSAARVGFGHHVAGTCGLAAEHDDDRVAAAVAQHRDGAHQPGRAIGVDPQRLRSASATPGSGGQQDADNAAGGRLASRSGAGRITDALIIIMIIEAVVVLEG